MKSISVDESVTEIRSMIKRNIILLKKNRAFHTMVITCIVLIKKNRLGKLSNER